MSSTTTFRSRCVLGCNISRTLESTFNGGSGRGCGHRRKNNCMGMHMNMNIPRPLSVESDAMVLNLDLHRVPVENNVLLRLIRKSLNILLDDTLDIKYTIIEDKGTKYMIRFLSGPYLTPMINGPFGPHGPSGPHNMEDPLRQYSADVEQMALGSDFRSYDDVVAGTCGTARRRVRIDYLF